MIQPPILTQLERDDTPDFNSHIATKLGKHILFRLSQVKSFSANDAVLLGYAIGFYTGCNTTSPEEYLTESITLLKLLNLPVDGSLEIPSLLEYFHSIAIESGEEWQAGEKAYG